MSDEAIEVPFRVDGGAQIDHSRAVAALEPPVLIKGKSVIEMMTDVGNAVENVVFHFANAFGKIVENLNGLFGFYAYPLDQRRGYALHHETRVIKPAKGGKTCFAWRYDRWVPVHREHGRGWVWSE